MADIINFRNDAKFKKYQSAIEKTLQTFESIGEWADIISFLNRLSKVLETSPYALLIISAVKTLNSFNYPYIPEKYIVNKRLSQCMNPNLPAGVHQKALEVYDIIFTKIKPEDIATDLSIYAIGIYPLFEHAATMVKTTLLNFVEKHILPLQSIPNVSSLLLAIIPALEDETAEHFTRVYEIIVKLKSQEGTKITCGLWTLLAVSAKHRAAIINFFSKDLPSGPHSSDILNSICGNDPGLVCKSLSASLQDKHALVIRGLLDLIISHFPLSSFKYFEEKDLILLIKSAMMVFLKRDMSLTRRFYIWLTPNDELSPDSLKLQVEAFLTFLRDIDFSLPDTILKPFRLIVSLMDRPTVCNPILRETFTSLLRTLGDSLIQIHDPESLEKITHTANLLFENVELDLAWSEICKKVRDSEEDELIELIECIDRCIERVSLCDDEAKAVHLPTFLFSLSLKIQTEKNQHASSRIYALYSKILNITINQGDDSVLSTQADRTPPPPLCELKAIVSRFCSQGSFDVDNIAGSYWLFTIMESLEMISKTLFEAKLDLTAIRCAISLHEMFFNPLENSSWFSFIDFLDRFSLFTKSWINNLIFQCNNLEASPSDRKFMIKAIGDAKRILKSSMSFENFVTNQTQLVWNHALNKRLETVHLSDILLNLALLDCLQVENVLCSYLAMTDDKMKLAKNIDLFMEIWILTNRESALERKFYVKPLCRFVELLDDPLSESFISGSLWLRNYVEIVPRILDIFIDYLFDGLSAMDNEDIWIIRYTRKYNISRVKYAIDRIKSILLQTVNGSLNFLHEVKISKYLESKIYDSVPRKFQFECSFDYTYNSAILQILIPYLSAQPPITGLSISSDEIDAIQSSCLEVIKIIIDTNSLLMTSREILPLIEVSRALLRYYVEIGSICKTPKYLNLLLRVFQLKNEYQIDIKDLASLCSEAFEIVQDANLLKAWIDFCLIPSEPELTYWSEFLDIQLQKLTDVFEKEQIQNKTTHGLYDETLVGGIEQLMVYGLAIVAADRNQIVKSKPRKFEAFRNALIRTSSNLPQTELNSEINSAIIRSFQYPIVTLIKALDFNSKFAFEALQRLFSKNPLIIISVLMILWENNETRRAIKAITDLTTSPFSDDFLRNIGIYLRQLKERESLNDIYLDVTITVMEDCVKLQANSEDYGHEILSVISMLSKDAASNLGRYKHVLGRLLSLYSLTLNSSLHKTTFDVRKIPRDVMDGLYKLLEVASTSCSKMLDLGNWSEWPNPELLDPVGVCDFSAFRPFSKDVPSLDLISAMIFEFLPIAHKVLIESERHLAFMALIFNFLIGPCLKGSIRKHFPGILAISAFRHFVVQDHSTIKIWKKDFFDCIFDNQFFAIPECYLDLLSDATASLLKYDPERFLDFLGKSLTTAGSTIFLSREAEAVHRASSLKRLCFAIFSSETKSVNYYMTSIQEKIVEHLRQASGQYSPEVFFMWRILLFKIGVENMSSFWPIIFTELVIIFDAVLTTSREVPSKDVTFAFVQACKLIDLLLIVSPSVFLLYNSNIFPIDSIANSEGISYLERLCKKFSSDTNEPRKVVGCGCPLLTDQIGDFQELRDFAFSAIKRLKMCSSLPLIARPDNAAIRRSILVDFVESI